MTQLVRYDAMCQAIAEAHRVDEVKDIRDKALAIEIYSRQAKNMEAELKACEIRIRAERRAGEMLAVMEKAKAAPGNQHTGKLDPSPEGSGPKTLSEIGITHKQSSNWQRLAAVPQEQFDRAFDTTKKPTTSGIINASRAPKAKPSKEREAALYVWGRVREFDREHILSVEPAAVFGELEAFQIEDFKHHAPRIIEWLTELLELCDD
jgi:hypothetical protein